jgi:hypothetical protein
MAQWLIVLPYSHPIPPIFLPKHRHSCFPYSNAQKFWLNNTSNPLEHKVNHNCVQRSPRVIRTSSKSLNSLFPYLEYYASILPTLQSRIELPSQTPAPMDLTAPNSPKYPQGNTACKPDPQVQTRSETKREGSLSR